MGGSRYGHELAGRLWPMQEWAMLRRAAEAGVAVPHPMEQTDHRLMMAFIGDASQADQISASDI
jgi:serine/threonine-protein kinase RIO1